MISIKNLSYSYPRDHLVFNDLSCEINQGEFWGILGRNGAGKTTLIDLILGIKYPSNGEVRVLNKDPNSPKEDHQNEVVFLSQDIQVKGDITIEEFLKFHSYFYNKYSKDIEQELLQYFDLDPGALVGALSTGQQKKVQVISGLASDTKIIIIDEITAVLDPETRFKFFSKILEFNKKLKKTVILATNIAEDLKGRVDRILYINDFKGEVLDPSKIDEIFTTK
jgi:ABC-2 type transport system ATP-binding protein